MGRGRGADDIFYGDSVDALEVPAKTSTEKQIASLIADMYSTLTDPARSRLYANIDKRGGAVFLQDPGDYRDLWHSKPFENKEMGRRELLYLSLEMDDPPRPRLTLHCKTTGGIVHTSKFVGRGVEEKDVSLAIDRIREALKSFEAPAPSAKEILQSVQQKSSLL